MPTAVFSLVSFGNIMLMKWPLIVPFFFLVALSHAQGFVVDRHAVALFDAIPEAYRLAAADIRMLFMDRSVGWNISQYLDCLAQSHVDAPNFCKRFEHQDPAYAVDPAAVYWTGEWDRTRWRYDFWPANCSEDVTCFIDHMAERLDSFDVMGCQFSYLAVAPGSDIADTVTGFFGAEGNANKASTYLAFAEAHPDKTVIWWTTSLARGIGTPESASFNAQMRDYAALHDIILFDVADILAHDPDGLPCFDNRDGVPYKDEHHPDDGIDIPAICPQYTTETEGGHLGAISAGGIRVAKAFWVLMARVAGWQPDIAATSEEGHEPFVLSPNPASHAIMLDFNSESSNPLMEITLIDACGRALRTFEGISPDASGTITLPLDGVPPGIWFIAVRMGGSRFVQRFIKT
jgi:hypothetical protein